MAARKTGKGILKQGMIFFVVGVMALGMIACTGGKSKGAEEAQPKSKVESSQSKDEKDDKEQKKQDLQEDKAKEAKEAEKEAENKQNQEQQNTKENTKE